MKRIFIGRSKYLQFDFALVDDDIYDYLNQWRWHGDSKGYVIRRVRKGGKKLVVQMHREVMKTPEGMVTDHIDGNRYDNRRENLRVCTDGENKRNRGRAVNNPTPYKGAYWQKQIGRWYSRIQVDNKSIYLGTFGTPEEAAMAYDRAALRYHGEFARLN